MIYPNVTSQRWLEKYPELDLLERPCDGCGAILISNRPFLMHGYAGVISPDCVCGKNRGYCSSRVTTSKVEHDNWLELTKGFLERTIE